MPFSRSKNNCCVVGCSNTYAKGREGIIFHSFPTERYDPLRRKKWIAAVNRLGKDGNLWQPSKHSRVCSAHFVGGKKSNNMHHPGYIPKIFPEIYNKPAINQVAQEDRYLRFRKRQKVHAEEINGPPNDPPAIPQSPSFSSSGTHTNLLEAEESNFDNSSNPTDDEPVGEYVLPTVPKDVQATTSTKNESFLDSPSTSFSPSFDQPVPVKNSSILPTKTIIHSNALVPTTSLLTRKRPVQIPKSFNTETDPSDETTKKLKCINDEFTHFGNNVASQLRNMSLEKALLCQNEIMMVLMKYRVESLQSTTTSPSSPPQSQLNPIPISNIKVEVTDF